MKHFFGRDKESDDLERRLRRDRPEPRPEFLAMLSDRIESRLRHRRGVSMRVGLVGAVTAVMLIAMSAVGGLGYAAAAAQGVASAAKAVVVAPASKSDNKGSDNSGNNGNNGNNNGNNGDKGDKGGKGDKGDQGDDKEYGHHQKMCHKKGKDQETIDVDDNAVPAHLSQGDTRGECPKKR